MKMPAHKAELKTNAHVERRPHDRGRPVASQLKALKAACPGGFSGQPWPWVPALGSEDKWLIRANALPSQFNQRGFVDCSLQAQGFVSNLVWKHASRALQPGTSGAGEVVAPFSYPNKRTQ